jgi:hypothetical protein
MPSQNLYKVLHPFARPELNLHMVLFGREMIYSFFPNYFHLEKNFSHAFLSISVRNTALKRGQIETRL